LPVFFAVFHAAAKATEDCAAAHNRAILTIGLKRPFVERRHRLPVAGPDAVKLE
jgi:hypothetical protein